MTIPAVLSSAVAPDAPKPKDAAGAARQFEALMLAQLLRNAHSSSNGSLDGEGDQTAEPMWDIAAQHFAQIMADRGGLGLAKLVAKGLSTEYSPPSPPAVPE